MESTALAQSALEPDAPTHAIDQLRDDRQAQPSATKPPAGRNISLRKSFEDELLFFRRNSDPCIGDAEVQNNAILVLRLFAHLYDNAAALGKLEGIADEIEENLSQAG